MARRSLEKLHDSRYQLQIYASYAMADVANRFWLRAIKTSCASSQERFIRSFAEYAYAVSDEASDRANGSIRSTTDYLRLTRLTAGPYPCFFPLEMDLDLPEDVMSHPALEMLRSMAAESLVLGNVGTI
jgi:Delta6-protoilludene synthase